MKVPLSSQYDHLPHVIDVTSEKPPEKAPPKLKKAKRNYAELRAASAFSFLDGATLPEDLIYQAAERGVPAMALIDRNGVYGAPRFYMAAKKVGVNAIVGAELRVESDAGRRTQDPTQHSALSTQHSALSLLVENRDGYKNLCKLVTAGALGRLKGEPRYTWEMVEEFAGGLHCLTRADEATIHKISGIFRGRTHIELQRHHVREEEHRNQALLTLARRLRLPIVATNGVRYARPGDKELHDVLTCIREGKHVDNAGRLLGINRERHVKDAAEMHALFSDLPQALDNAWELSQRLDFTLANLGYQFPEYPLPPNESPMSFLRKITWNAAMTRFRPLTAKAQAQIEKELAMIEKLDLAGYFLIVWDIVQFCAREKILVQGRGSAANSAVCYALAITAVDPVKMELLFERFLSEERGEWPDIDLDLPSGDQREKVIQHVYKTYGVHGAAMTANVITYRDRSAAREVGKALGFSLEQADKLSKCVSTWNFGEIREVPETMAVPLAAAGFDPEDIRVRHFMRLQTQIQNLPRHLGQHSGGMVMAKGRLDEVVPLEPASMPGRVVIQWDKDDCADLGIIKVDLLGLGMLQAIEEAIPMIRRCEGIDVDLAHLPENDPLVYKMLNEADTVGMFQVESRAQMASLPRNKPECFYDIVVQVAIIRPGPIVGGMIKPFFDRRQKRVPVEYPHPCLEPILKRTLGVPLFQEQLLRIAMVAANFTGGEAEELRRAMGFKRSMERMQEIEKRLRAGMTKNGIGIDAQNQIVKSITSFALYGFPESHAASFALIAYASAYLKARHPAAFYISLLNAWPMGFYHPATLIKDAERHRVKVLPVDVNHSGWRCRWENGGVRLGLRFVKGLREVTGKRIESVATGFSRSIAESGRLKPAPTPFVSADDLAIRANVRSDQLTKLAYAGALASLGLRRRAALWQAAQAAKPAGELFEEHTAVSESPLDEMSRVDETLADYSSMEMTTGPHLLTHFRGRLKQDGVVTAKQMKKLRNGSRVATAGAVIVRQRPGTAKGFVFLTLEDETGISQAIVNPQLFADHRALIVGSAGLVVEGVLQNADGQCSVRAERFWPLEGIGEVASHDFH
jgi:error-prone DNA polymerase